MSNVVLRRTFQEGFGSKFVMMISMQMKQVAELRSRRRPRHGKLVYFRKSLGFDVDRSSIEDLYPEPIFANVEDIEGLEKQVQNNDFTELIVQCCSICVVYRALVPGFYFYTTDDHLSTWIFANVRSVEDVAMLRYRLGKMSSDFKLAIDRFTIGAVFDAALLVHPTWQEYVMIFRSASCTVIMDLLHFFGRFFQRAAIEMPKPALSLLLSYIAQEANKLGGAYHFFCRPMVVRLVSQGASLLVSRQDHPALYKSIQAHLKLEETPWWLEPEEKELEKRGPTTLVRLMNLGWDASDTRLFRERVCCSLDLTGEREERFAARNASLQCLASRKLSASQLKELPQCMKHLAAKHLPVAEEES